MIKQFVLITEEPTVKFNNAVRFAESVHCHTSVTTEIFSADIRYV